MNGGFGLVLDGSPEAGRRARMMLSWDVSNGVARRAWAGNGGARFAIEEAMRAEPLMRVTLPYQADEALVEKALKM
jgi:urocanate hydratase